MRKEDIEAVGKAISVIIDKCHSRVIIDPLLESQKTCTGCKWEFEIAKECEECARVMTDNYKEAKKKLTFSERQKIVREYQDWCLFNNAADCAESFLAYLCIKGYIDG